MRRMIMIAVFLKLAFFVHPFAWANENAAASSSAPTFVPGHSKTTVKAISTTTDAVLEKIRSTTQTVMAEKNWPARRVAIDDLESYLQEANNAKPEPTDSAIRFQVALEPLFESKADLNSKKSCQTVREKMIYKFASGSGFRGSLPDFVLESLKFLSAVCQNPSLSKPPASANP
ncbi:MAG: hypothetical protein NDI61_01070 [Bdellovibrionaceae bacterium]|nr:hypothetical protein [Pseudobdellovibrionaceae bacterium]